MMNHQLVRNLLWMVTLIFLALACNLAIRLTRSINSFITDLTSDLTSATSAPSGTACTSPLRTILSVGRSDGSAVSPSAIFGHDHEVDYLVVYDAHGNKLGKREDLLPSDTVDEKLNSRAAHEAIWHTFTSLIPAEGRSFVTEFALLSDGSDNILAGVSPTYYNPREWTLKVDIVDAANIYGLLYSLLHEYGHLLTLNASQVSPDNKVFYYPDDQAIYEQAANSCSQYFTGEGCSYSNSYMNEFFNRYWSSFYAEWQQTRDPQQTQLDLSYDFYWLHANQFLTSYAATNPEEDIAESWAFFILSPKPEPDSIASQKILFFYEYPELVSLRQEIRNRLCTSFSGN
jgi:hypothetical protein